MPYLFTSQRYFTHTNYDEATILILKRSKKNFFYYYYFCYLMAELLNEVDNFLLY